MGNADVQAFRSSSKTIWSVTNYPVLLNPKSIFDNVVTKLIRITICLGRKGVKYVNGSRR